MKMISSPVDEIKSRLDIIEVIQGYIRLQKAGRNYRAVCPFHSEKTPSLMVSPERQIWKCFGCGKGGSIFDFVMEIEGVEFGDALRILAQKAGVELKKTDSELADKWRTERNQLYEICSLAGRFFVKQLEASQTGKKIQNYLTERGLKSETIKEWQIGYAPNQWQALLDFLGSRGYSDEQILKTGLIIRSERPEAGRKYYDRFRDRIIFPIFDISDLIVGFTGRENPSNPDERMGKYINIPNTLIYDKSRILYGLNKAKIDIRKKDFCIIAEGQMDVIMSHQAGFKNTIASSGTSLTEQQLKIIKRYTENLAMAFDMDLAGEMATKRGIDLAVQSGFNTRVVSLPDNKDPAECIQNNADLWSQAINKSQELTEFYVASAFSRYNSKTAEGKKTISKILLPVLKRIPNRVEQAHWLQEVARRLGIQESILSEEMKKYNLDKSRVCHHNQSINSAKKSQANNLEEHLLGMVLANLGKCAYIKDEPSYIFADDDLKEIFKRAKKELSGKNNFKRFQKSLPDNLASKANDMIFGFEAVYSLSDDFDLKREINFSLSQLKGRYLRQKLNKLNLNIREAENKNDRVRLKKLTEEFNKLMLEHHSKQFYEKEKNKEAKKN